MEQFCFTTPALPLVFATGGDEVGRPLQIKRPASSPTEVEELDDEGIAVRRESFFGFELFVEESPSFAYGEGELPLSKVEEVDLMKRMLSSSMVLVGRKEEQNRDARWRRRRSQGMGS